MLENNNYLNNFKRNEKNNEIQKDLAINNVVYQLNNNFNDLIYVTGYNSYCKQIIIGQNGKIILFSCNSLIIIMNIETKYQFFLKGKF